MEQLPLDLGFPNPVAAAQKMLFLLRRMALLGRWSRAQGSRWSGGAERPRLDRTPFRDFSAYLGSDPVLQIKVSSRHFYEINSVALYL